ncbi:MAG: DUF5982 domain-containing protein [Bacteroidia bacterium]|nr:DUF5982 domain-containing protein [Bacteroidia bacterium]
MRHVLLLSALGWTQDTILIDPRKRLRPYELSRKREGWVLLGYPTAGYDALRGIGAAIAASIAYNGRRDEAPFSFQPYKYYFFGQIGFFQRESRYFRFFGDFPWIGGKPYRLTFRFNYRDESQGQFWGIGEKYIGRYIPIRSIHRYDKALQNPFQDSTGEWRTNLAQHYFQITQWQSWLIGERIEKRGLLRLMGGVRWVTERHESLEGRLYRLRAPDGSLVTARQTLTFLDSAERQLLSSPPSVYFRPGVWLHRFFIGGALVWDSRDFEINPNSGWFLEIGHESLFPSWYTHKSHVSLRYYHILYKTPSEKFQLSGALHWVGCATYGRRILFTDLYYYSRWSEGRSINLITGPSTVRAFRENRFAAPLVYLFQYELRSRVAEFRFLRQHFTGGPIVFVDLGTGSDNFALPIQKWLTGAGVGARILWNMNFILRADAAYGREGWQIHFTTGHTF